MSEVETTKTRSGRQAYTNRGRKDHTMSWYNIDENGYINDHGVNGGNYCMNCGAWDGPKLARGMKKMLREWNSI